MNDAVEVNAEQLVEYGGRPTGTTSKESECRRDESPNPGFGLAFFGRRLINIHRALFGELLREFVIGRLDGLGGSCGSATGPSNRATWRVG